MTYAEQYALLIDPAFRGRVQMAALAYAAVVQAEDATTPNHPRRNALARSMFDVPEQQLARFMFAVASVPAIASAGPVNSTDAQLDAAISAAWTQIAKATA